MKEGGSMEKRADGAIIKNATPWLRDGIGLALAFAIGSWAHSGRTAEAQSANVLFQLQGLGNGTSLSLYYPDQRTIYVYANAMTGFSKLNCAYEFRLGDPGGPVQRQNCKVPAFQP
jgi:hypothetical protein